MWIAKFAEDFLSGPHCRLAMDASQRDSAVDLAAVRVLCLPHMYLNHPYALPAPFPPKRQRLSKNDTLLSKIARALISNMSTIGIHCMKKGDYKRGESLEKLCKILNADMDVLAATNQVPLVVSTIKSWIDTDVPLIVEAGMNAQRQAAENGGEQVHDGPSKVQQDWMEAFARFSELAETLDSAGKSQEAMIKSRLKSSAASEAMLFVAGQACGHRACDIATNTAKDCVEVALSRPEASEEDKPQPAAEPGDRTKASFTESVSVALEESHAARKQAEADEAAARKLEAEVRILEAEARKSEAEAIKYRARAKSQEALIAQLQQVTAIHDAAASSGDRERAAKYKRMMDILDDHMLASIST